MSGAFTLKGQNDMNLGIALKGECVEVVINSRKIIDNRGFIPYNVDDIKREENRHANDQPLLWNYYCDVLTQQGA